MNKLYNSTLGMDPEVGELLKVIDFAFAQRNYSRVIKAIDDSSNRIQPSKQLALMRAKACIELSKIEEGIADINKSIQLGSTVQEYGLLQIRAYLQGNHPQKAEKTLKKFIKDNRAMEKIYTYTKAISIFQDSFEVHCLDQKEEQLFKRMKQRLYTAGAQFDKLRVANLSKGYRGVIAAKTINKKTPIVYIPKSEIMTLEMAKNNKFCQRLIAKNYKLLSPKHTYLSILLLEEKANPHSRWRLYIDSLPADHSSFPINFTIQELQMLEGSPFLYMIHEKVMDLKKDYTTILRSDSNFEKYSFMEFCWARMMVGSRIFGVNICGVKTQILVPFADMLNHKLPKQTAWNYSDDFNGFVIESLQKIEVGEEVFDSYGKKCNTRFLLNYGFVIPNNQDNQIALKIGMNDNTPLYKQKMAMLKLHYQSQFAQIMKTPLNTNSGKFFQLMGFLRFVNVDTKQNLDVLAKISKITETKDPYRPSRTPPISIPNQISIWRHFLQICRQSLAQYKSTLAEDKQLLTKKNLSQNMKNIIILRMGEKQILKEFIEMGQQLIIILTSENIIEQLIKYCDKPYFRYIYKILNLTPGINKKQLEKKLGALVGNQVEQQLEEKDEDAESCIRNQC